jgi:hypothetical protein
MSEVTIGGVFQYYTIWMADLSCRQKSAVTGELLATKAALQRTRQAAEEYKDKLSTAENRVERLKSSTVQKLEAQALSKHEDPTLNGSSTPKTEPEEVGGMVYDADCALII